MFTEETYNRGVLKFRRSLHFTLLAFFLTMAVYLWSLHRRLRKLHEECSALEIANDVRREAILIEAGEYDNARQWIAERSGKIDHRSGKGSRIPRTADGIGARTAGRTT